MDILRAARHNLEAGILTWMEAEELPPFLWACGDDRMITASPYRSDADTDHIADLLTLIGRLADARVIGRTAEAWIAPADNDWGRPDNRLGEQIGMDPTIRTAIVVQACSIPAGDGVMMVAVTGINDDGQRWWETTEPTLASPEMSTEVFAAAETLRELGPIPVAYSSDMFTLSEETLARMGWTLISS